MKTPTTSHAERLERLLEHCLRGWTRVRANPAELSLSRRWLGDHPSSWSAVDELWRRALDFEGPLAAWLDAGARPEAWRLELPLHSALASHPFACLSP
jgi:hypothetical protein